MSTKSSVPLPAYEEGLEPPTCGPAERPSWCRWSCCSACPKSRQKHCSCLICAPVWGKAGRTLTLVQAFSGESTSLGLSWGVVRYGKTNPVGALSIGLCVLLRSYSCRETHRQGD